MNGPGDPVASPVLQAVNAHALGTGPEAQTPLVVEHHYERRVAVEVERNSKGYRWHLSVAADDSAVVQDLVNHLDTWLAARFGSDA